MPVVPIDQPVVTVLPELAEVAEGPEDYADPVTRCARCRLTFLRHPSVTADDAAEWWLCPPCRNRLSGRNRK